MFAEPHCVNKTMIDTSRTYSKAETLTADLHSPSFPFASPLAQRACKCVSADCPLADSSTLPTQVVLQKYTVVTSSSVYSNMVLLKCLNEDQRELYNMHPNYILHTDLCAYV